MQHLQRALLVADGRELVRALERILGFLCGERVSCGSVSLSAAAQLSRSGGWRLLWCASLAARGLSRGAVPSVRSALTAVLARGVVSQKALQRVFVKPDAAAHVKILISHGASELAAGASLVADAASRRAALNLWLRALAGAHWQASAGLLEANKANSPAK